MIVLHHTPKACIDSSCGKIANRFDDFLSCPHSITSCCTSRLRYFFYTIHYFHKRSPLIYFHYIFLYSVVCRVQTSKSIFSISNSISISFPVLILHSSGVNPAALCSSTEEKSLKLSYHIAFTFHLCMNGKKLDVLEVAQGTFLQRLTLQMAQ